MGIGRKIVPPRALLHLMWLHLLCLQKRGASAWAGTMVITGIVSSRLAPFNANHSFFLCRAYGCNSVFALKHPAPTPSTELSQPPPPPQPEGQRWSHREPSFWECVQFSRLFAYTFSLQWSALASCLFRRVLQHSRGLWLQIWLAQQNRFVSTP